KLGYGFEVASATMNYARNVLRINKIVAITDPKNIASIKLLNKIGLQFEKTIKVAEHDTTLLFSPMNVMNDKTEIDKLTTRFYSLFTNTNGVTPNVEDIKDIFISKGTLINNTGDTPEVFNLKEFIEPRQKILTDGTLTNFIEKEIIDKTEIFGNIAQRFSLYEKSGKLNGENFETKGMKTIQFVKINKEWKMSSVAWCDEK
ncbi:MAG: GNAT family protein, partial [Ignavibacteriaceae bacterium]